MSRSYIFKRKLLIIHQGALGDLVAAFPVLELLRDKFGRIDALCQSQIGKLACHLKIIDRHLSIESGMFSSLYSGRTDPRMADLVRAYDRIILLSFSIQLEKALRNIRGPEVHRIPPRAHPDEKIDMRHHLLRHLAKIHQTAQMPDNHFDVKPHGAANPLRVIIHPGSGSRKKCWSLENFILVEHRLNAMQMRSEFLLGPAEGFLIDRLKSVPERAVHVSGDLCQVADLLRTAGGFIGNDSGISHLAGFLNIPTVVVFGPSDPARWKPFGRAVTALRPALNCQPCFEKDPDPGCGTWECLLGTSPDRVVEAFVKMLALTG